jgi:hypothetical protein
LQRYSFFFILSKDGKYAKIFADMNATRSVRPLTAAAKVNWTLMRFRTPLYEAVHSHRFRIACRHGLRTEVHCPQYDGIGDAASQ